MGMRSGSIQSENAAFYSRAEEVLENCDWLTGRELYVNPGGVRMVRGYSTDYGGAPERRYYVESRDIMFLMSMMVDPRFHDKEDCERLMQQTADSVRRR